VINNEREMNDRLGIRAHERFRNDSALYKCSLNNTNNKIIIIGQFQLEVTSCNLIIHRADETEG